MARLTFEFLATRHPKLLQFPVQVLCPNTRECHGEEFLSRHAFVEEPCDGTSSRTIPVPGPAMNLARGSGADAAV